MSTQSRTSSARKPSAAKIWWERCRTWLGRLTEFVDDRVNPIVIKELRQAVRGRFLNMMMLVFLLGQLVMLGMTLMSPEVRQTAWSSANAGSAYFRTLLLILLGTCLLFIPVYTAVRLGMEHSEQNTDLLFISTLSPDSIISGKFFASVLLTILLFSASAPFMSVSYLLRGIDFPTIFLLIALAFGVVMLCIMLGLFAASVASHRVFRLLMAIGFLGALALSFAGVMEASKIALQGGLGSRLMTHKFWVLALTLLVFGAFSFLLLYRLTVAMISPPSLNRARAVRTMFSIGWFASGLIMFGVAKATASFEFIYLWQVFYTGLLCVAFFVIVSERESMGQRAAREVPHIALLRIVAFPHFSGSASGLLWGAGLLAGTLLFPYTWHRSMGQDWFQARNFWSVWYGCAGVGLFAFAYAVTGLLVHRALLFNKVPTERIWMIGLGIMALCGVSPLLVMLLTLRAEAPMSWWILTPLAAFWANTQEAGAAVALVWSVVGMLGALPLILHQLFLFVPPRQSPANQGPSSRTKQSRSPTSPQRARATPSATPRQSGGRQ